MGEKSFLPDLVLKQGLVNSCLTRGADYEAYTGSMCMDENAPQGQYVVSMTASSTVQDLQRDIMAMSALDKMTQVPDNLTTFMNHTYDLPDSVYGGIYGRPWIQSSNGIADYHISMETEQSNPKAMQTYNMIAKSKRRLGCSIGCQVLDYDYDKTIDAIIIKDVMLIEISIVSIPANQRCWVEVATKSLFERSLLEGNADKALQLAPAVRGMYRKSYDSLIRHIEHEALKKDLERARLRPTAPFRIVNYFNESENGNAQFALYDDYRNIKKSLSREDVGRVVEENLVTKSFTPSNPTDSINLCTETPTNQTETIETEDLDTKSVCGNTSFPLMDIGTEWTGSKAESQIFAYAKDDDGEINVSKAKACFLYYNPSSSDTQDGYKMPFTYIADGSPKIVPKGVQTCAGVLNGSMGGVDAPGDQAGMKAKVKTMYGRINSQFKPDPEWVVPWEKKDSLEDEELTTKAKEKDGIADSNTDMPLNRQDLEKRSKDEKEDEKKGMPQASEVEVSSDGTHEACTGTHTHSHKSFGSQGSDEQHSHSHYHSDDSDHNHSHNDDSEKATEPETTKAQDDVPTQETPTQETTEDHLQRATLLEIYNDLGKRLGFESASLEKQKALMPFADGIDPQEVVTRLSLADSQIDWLMQVFGVPDIDGVDDGDTDQENTGIQTFPRFNSLDAQFAKAFNDFIVKEGRELSEKNKALIKAMHDHAKSTHDMCASMHPGSCTCSAVTVDEATDEARMQGEGQPIQQYPAMQRSIEAIEGLTKSLETMTVKSLVRSEVDAALDEAQKSLKQLREDQRLLIENIRKLKEMPLGRPTTMVGRSVEVTDGVTTFDELKSAGVNLLEISEDELEVVTIGSMKYKKYPAGYKAGQRRPLTEFQKTYMNPLSYYPYEIGSADVLVPILDEIAQSN